VPHPVALAVGIDRELTAQAPRVQTVTGRARPEPLAAAQGILAAPMYAATSPTPRAAPRRRFDPVSEPPPGSGKVCAGASVPLPVAGPGPDRDDALP